MSIGHAPRYDFTNRGRVGVTPKLAARRGDNKTARTTVGARAFREIVVLHNYVEAV